MGKLVKGGEFMVQDLDAKDIFIPEVFSARLEDIGIPFSIFTVNPEQNKLLDELGIEFIDQIPKSPSGKILRRVLRDRVG